MDVISLSSDSENSNSLDDTITYTKPTNIEEDVFLVDWNDERYSPTFSNLETVEKNDIIEILSVSPKEKKAEAQNDSDLAAKTKPSTSAYNISEINLLKSGNTNLQSPNTLLNEDNYHNWCTHPSPKKTPEKRSQLDKKSTKLLKEQEKQEKQKLKDKKKEEEQRQKILKAIFTENQRNLKPEENIKFLKVHIDNEIINSVFGGNIIMVLQQNNIQYGVESQNKSHTITWSKKRIIKELDDCGNITETLEHNEENELVYIIEWDKAVKLIHSNEILSHVETIKSVYLNKRITLVIYGLQKYFDFFKKKRKTPGKIPKLTEQEKAYYDAPSITKDELEFALTDLELFGKHNIRLLESPEELSGLILNFTKSLSQLDFKLEKQKRQEDDFDWFAKGGSTQTVKIDKDGKGLINLWQQQICQFSTVGVETAQAIVAQYNSPLALVNKYEECESPEEGECLLENIQVRRDLGLLSSTRRVGPQLSKKIFRFFTSDDPDEEL